MDALFCSKTRLAVGVFPVSMHVQINEEALTDCLSDPKR